MSSAEGQTALAPEHCQAKHASCVMLAMTTVLTGDTNCQHEQQLHWWLDSIADT